MSFIEKLFYSGLISLLVYGAMLAAMDDREPHGASYLVDTTGRTPVNRINF